MKTVLVVAAHPDDEVLGCGGTIVKWVREGAQVYTLIFGEGPWSRYSDRAEGFGQADVQQVSTFTAEAARILGTTETFTFKFPDNQFDRVPLLDLVKTVEDIKARVRPDVVLTHSRADLNIDHQLTYRAVLTACRPHPEETVREIYSFEIPSSTEWNYPQAFQPNYFVNIGVALDQKIAALRCYATEMKAFPFPRSEEALRAIAMRWGSVAGMSAAEAFEVIRIREV
ncbi:MAG: PIG-L deacetylase family protein [bacterium]|nr:PIG-L deacetylase family protein [bacterium]